MTLVPLLRACRTSAEEGFDLVGRKRCGRLVQYQDLNGTVVVVERPCDGDRAPVDRPQRRDGAVDVELDRQLLQQSLCLPALCRPVDEELGPASVAEPEGNVLHRGEVLDDSESLMDELQTHSTRVTRRAEGKLFAADPDDALGVRRRRCRRGS